LTEEVPLRNSFYENAKSIHEQILLFYTWAGQHPVCQAVPYNSLGTHIPYFRANRKPPTQLLSLTI
jgi:hypothetical protein